MEFLYSWVIRTVVKTISKSWMCSNFRQIQSPATMLATLEHLNNKSKNVVTTLVPSCFIGSSLLLQVTRLLLKLDEFGFWPQPVTDYEVS